MLDVSSYTDYRSYLSDFFDEKKAKTTGFSYTTWSRRLDLKSPSTLIMIVNGQRHPGPKLTEKLADYFGFSEKDRKYFMGLVRLKKSGNSAKECIEVMKDLQLRSGKKGLRFLEYEQFQVLSRWYSAALREMIHLKDFVESDRWMSQKLNFSVKPAQVNEMLNLLLQYKLLKRSRYNKLKVTSEHIDTPQGVYNEAIRAFNLQALENARKSIYEVEPELREISGVTFGIRQKNIGKAKNLIRKFQMEIVQLLEDSPSDSVYQLQVAFFPLTKTTSLGGKDEN